MWNSDANDGFAVVDVNQDDMKEVVAVLGGNVALLNGKDGTSIYTLQEVFYGVGGYDFWLVRTDSSGNARADATA